MTDPMFKVVFSGEVMPGFTLDNVKSYLATLFKSDLSKIDSLFTGRQVVLKRELKEADADKYVAILRNAGALVHKESDLAASLSLVATEEHDSIAATTQATDSSQMTCPKCGHAQVKAVECAACGIIIDKYIARQAQQLDTDTPALPGKPAALSSTPYAPPQSAVGEALPEYAELNVFSVDGRIGRLRYMAWTLSLTLLIFVAVFVVLAGYFLTPTLGYLLGAITVIGVLVVGIMISVQRLHDIGWSGWMLLLTLIPVMGSLFNLLMMLMPGSNGANRFGAPPPENSRAVKIMAGLWLALMAIGIAGAMVAPDLQQYLPVEQ